MDQTQLLKSVKYDDKGLVPVIAQDFHSKKVRMLAYMNQETLRLTLETGKVHYYSRSRQSVWLKGETSGHYQYLKGISMDCDGDALLIQIEQVGGISCHTGHATCFYQESKTEEVAVTVDETINTSIGETLDGLQNITLYRKQYPKEGSYTNYLFDAGIDKILKKVGEEATEVVIAAKNSSTEELTFEVADLMYHLTVLLAQKGLGWEAIAKELAKRK